MRYRYMYVFAQSLDVLIMAAYKLLELPCIPQDRYSWVQNCSLGPIYCPQKNVLRGNTCLSQVKLHDLHGEQLFSNGGSTVHTDLLAGSTVHSIPTFVALACSMVRHRCPIFCVLIHRLSIHLSVHQNFPPVCAKHRDLINCKKDNHQTLHGASS